MSDSKVNHLSHIPIYRKIHFHLLPFFVSLSMVIIIAVLLTGCGTSPGNTDSGTADNNESNIIGSAGGTVTSSNGKVKIVIPSGALNKDTDITVSAVSNQPSGNIGTAYEVEPDGTTFNKPVTISITYDETSLPAGVSESDIKLGTVTNNQWQAITDSSVNPASNTINGTITHLSTYGIMAVNTGSVPSAPTGIAAIAGDGKVTISWDAVPGATSYNIYWSTISGVTKTTGTKITGVTTPYTHTGRTNGTIYYYVVTAVNSYGESGESVQVSATPTSSVFPDNTAPSNTTGNEFINGGSASTNSASVTLTISATDNTGVTGYCAKESSTAPSHNNSCWISVSSTPSYSAGVAFTLSSGEGTKTVYVWFKDEAGNVSASTSDTITLDTVPPDTSITSQPPNPSNSTSASFSFSSAETGSTFQCRIDNGSYSACTSPKSYTGLTDDSHTFEVKSTDASGNTDLTPANYTWVVINTLNQIGTPYQAKDGLTVKLNGLSVIKKTNTYKYIIDYTLTNNTKDQAIDEGTFKMFYAGKEGGQPQYGFFGRLFPGDTINKTYVFEDMKSNPFDVLEYGDNFFVLEPVADSLKWKVVTENAPVANAGSDQTVVIESLVTLDGSGSTDADGDSLSYNWSFTSIPTNSSAVLNNSSTANPSFVADAVGEYVLSLVVNDGMFESVANVITVTVTLGTNAPSNTTISNFINSGAATTDSTTVTLSLSATDNVGITGYCANESSATPSINDTCWTSIASTTSYSAGVTFTLSSVDATKTLYVWFKDKAGNISSAASDSITLSTIPAVPTAITAATGDGQATIGWNTVSGATSYNVYWSTTSGVTKSSGTNISGITSTSYTHTGLTNGIANYYVVSAVNDSGESEVSAEVTVTPQSPIPLPKTGQTTCFNSEGNGIACAGTGQDGDLQKGIAWPNPRFTDNGDSTVTDNLTGLVWTKDGNAPGPVACSPLGIKTWQGALDYVVCLNSNSYLGYTDWRLPNVNELRSLAHYGQSGRATWLNSHGFNNVKSTYWSSTTYAFYPNNAWIVGMNGYASDDRKSYGDYYVWPVRSGQSGLFGSSIIQLPKTGQTTCYDSLGNVIACSGTGQDGDLQRGVAWPNPMFADNGDGTVTDNLTGLAWTKDGNAPGPASCTPAVGKAWQAALNYVACLNANSYLGYTDWRLPNVNELRSIVHDRQSDTATWLNSHGFNNVKSSTYWSSTTNAYDPISALIVVMWDGYMSNGNKFDYSSSYVWPVRSGQ